MKNKNKTLEPYYLHSGRTENKTVAKVAVDRKNSTESYLNNRHSRNYTNEEDKSIGSYSSRRYKLRCDSKESLYRKGKITETYSQGSLNSKKIFGNASNSTYKRIYFKFP
mmetsp:Transcript_26727/g.23591  ORF Transcript_26727/g.23591 Transcript_26727/m.23591 type:complete len:110 (+) Transcript_26727:38-367(+)